MPKELVSFQGKTPVVTSMAIAENFGVSHKNILRRIRSLTAQNCAVLSERFFIIGEYANAQDKKQPMFYLTRDGFTLLAMGLTGPKALEWKLKYIAAFNRMEKLLREKMTTEYRELKKSASEVRRQGTDSIKRFVEYATRQGSTHAPWYYSSITRLVNSTVGISSRDEATAATLAKIAAIDAIVGEHLDALMERGMMYRDIYATIKANLAELRRLTSGAAVVVVEFDRRKKK